MARRKGYAIGKHVGFLLQPGDERIADWLNQQENVSLAIKQALLSLIELEGRESPSQEMQQITMILKRIEEKLDQGITGKANPVPATVEPTAPKVDEIEINADSENFLNGLLDF